MSSIFVGQRAECVPVGALVEKLLIVVAISFLAGLWNTAASAQDYPSKPLTLIVPFPRGGPTDAFGRVIATNLALQLVRDVSVRNLPGAFGTIGMEAVAKSPADGYVLGLCSFGTIASASSLYPTLGYDPIKSFAPISLIGKAPYLIVVHPSVAAKSLRELIDLAKATPGQLVFGSSGNAGTSHIAGEMFKLNAGVNIAHAPYRGISPALNDLLTGRIQIMFEQSAPAPFLVNIRGGKLIALAVAATHRTSLLPDVPTAAEAGLSDFEVGNWFGLVAPSGTPSQVIRRLNQELPRILSSNYYRDTLLLQGVEPMSSSAEEFSIFIARETETISRVIKTSNIKLD